MIRHLETLAAGIDHSRFLHSKFVHRNVFVIICGFLIAWLNRFGNIVNWMVSRRELDDDNFLFVCLLSEHLGTRANLLSICWWMLINMFWNVGFLVCVFVVFGASFDLHDNTASPWSCTVADHVTGNATEFCNCWRWLVMHQIICWCGQKWHFHGWSQTVPCQTGISVAHAIRCRCYAWRCTAN